MGRRVCENVSCIATGNNVDITGHCSDTCREEDQTRKRLRSLERSYPGALQEDYAEELQQATTCLEKGDSLGCNKALDSMNLD